MPASTFTAVSEEAARIQDEIDRLRARLVAARKAAPPEVVQDYALKTADGGSIMLSALFGDRRDLLVVHNMGRSCPYCTLWADGFSALAAHLENRTAFVLSSPDDPATLAAFAADRGWQFRTVSTAGSTFTSDLGFENEPGMYLPGVSALHRKDDGTIVRVAAAPFGPGDEFCPVWHFFDLLADGPNGWTPKYAY